MVRQLADNWRARLEGMAERVAEDVPNGTAVSVSTLLECEVLREAVARLDDDKTEQEITP